MIYYCLYGVFALVWALIPKNEQSIKRTNRNYAVFACIFLILLFGLRHPSMGIDLHFGETYGYLGSFDLIRSLSWKEAFEIKLLNYEQGYIVLNKIIGMFGESYQTFLIAIAALSLIPTFYMIGKESDDAFLSIIIYMGLPSFLANFSAVRQSLAIGIIALSIVPIRDKKLIRFILLVLLASTLHFSAIVFLLAYPLYNLSFSKLFKWVSLIIIPVVYLFRYQIFSVLGKFFRESTVAQETGAITLFLVFTAIYIFCLFFADENDKDQCGLRNLFWMACICQAFGGIYEIAMRVGYYFMIPLIILLPKILRTKSEGSLELHIDNAIIYAVVFISFTVFGLYSIATSTWAQSGDYHFYWSTYIQGWMK